jgi:hypothetical protein
MLFIESGFEPAFDLVQAVVEVFTSCGDPVPGDIPEPPAGWEARYEELAHELRLPQQTLAVAVADLREFWNRARSHAPEEGHAAVD